jgi:voltage-gated potassium channel
MGRPRRRPLRPVLNEIMEPYRGEADSTRLSLGVDLLILVCILASCALIPLELAYPAQARLFWYLELGLVGVFILEYLLRWYAAPNRLLHPISFFAVVDLVAILPTLLMLSNSLLALRLVRGFRFVRMLRMLRLLRLLKFLRFGMLIYRGLVSLRIYISTLDHQYHIRKLGRLFLWAAVAWVIGANLIHITELKLVGEQGPFADYWRSYWHVLIVLVSGIEDKEPLSTLGRVEITLLMITGIVVVGMLTGEIVSILVKKVQRAGRLAIKPPSSRFEEHVLILGNNSHLDNVVRQVSAALARRHLLVVVCPEAEELRVTEPAAYRRVYALAGDPVEMRVLEQADVDAALRVIVLAADDACADDPRQRDNQALMETLAVVCRQGGVPLVVELQTDESLRYATPLEGIDFLVGRHYGARLISQAVLKPGMTRVFDRLMTFTEHSNEFYSVPTPGELVGRPFAAAQLHFLDHDDEDITLVGLDRSPPEAPQTRFWLNPAAGIEGLSEEDLILRKGDNLLVVAYERPALEAGQEERWSDKILSRS